MFRKIIVCLSALLLVFSAGCSADKNNIDALCNNIASDYECTFNVCTADGGALFGGKLLHGESTYELTLSFPEEIAGTVICADKDSFSAQYGGKTVALVQSSVQKLDVLLGVLDAAKEKKELSPYKSELYGAKCMICDIGGNLLYYSHGVPLLIISDGIKAEITGFSAISQ